MRPLCKTAVVALWWAALTTPVTTLPLLYLLERAGGPLSRLNTVLPSWGVVAFVAGVLIGLPLIGVVLAVTAISRVRASWTPRRGGGFARAALWVGLLGAVTGTGLLVAGVR